MRQIAARRAMTLVELLGASALAVLLMTTAFGVIGSLAVQRRTLLGNDSVEPWRRQLSEQLRWELSNARKMSVRPRELRLVGYGATDFDTAEATHRPCEIVYSIQVEGGRYWLLRQEIHLDASTFSNSRTELVAAGITALEVYDLDNDNGDHDLNLATAASEDHDTHRAYALLPNRLRVVLHGKDENNTILDERVLLQ